MADAGIEQAAEVLPTIRELVDRLEGLRQERREWEKAGEILGNRTEEATKRILAARAELSAALGDAELPVRG